MLWLNVLHFYQPANSSSHSIREALDRSYWRIIRFLEANPHIRFTVNFSGCLLLRLHEMGEQDFFSRVKNLISKKQLEVVGSSAYHFLLPLVERDEVFWQIREQERILKDLLGVVRPKGFFLPEMGYSPSSAKIIAELGYDWLILDEIAAGASLGVVETNKVYIDENSGLRVMCRDRETSDHYFPDIFNKITGRNVVVTATDAELYGLRHQDETNNFEALGQSDMEYSTLSEYILSAKMPTPIYFLTSSWSTSVAEMEKGNPFPLWFNEKNDLHVELWNLAKMVYNIVESYDKDESYKWARWHMVRGMASCTFWWASGRDLSAVYGPVAWNPDFVELGTDDMTRAVRSLASPSSRADKMRVEKQSLRIKQLIWRKHWTNYWHK